MLLTRQRILLTLLQNVGRPLSPVAFVGMVFLLRHETTLRHDTTFYDFVPHKFGPFSFNLYRELALLRQKGLVAHDENRIALLKTNGSSPSDAFRELPRRVTSAITDVVADYGGADQDAVVARVHSHYPRYAVPSDKEGYRPPLVGHERPAAKVIYTAGYEGRSVDAFLDELMKAGVQTIVDVRANPVSRKYGFSGSSLRDIATKLGFTYRHHPELGIPSSERRNLGTPESYESLFDRYERQMIPQRLNELYALVAVLREKPCVLLCMERDPQRCHRTRLARAATVLTGFRIMHL
jgi:uncharacterized protein (DUF488 family)